MFDLVVSGLSADEEDEPEESTAQLLAFPSYTGQGNAQVYISLCSDYIHMCVEANNLEMELDNLRIEVYLPSWRVHSGCRIFDEWTRNRGGRSLIAPDWRCRSWSYVPFLRETGYLPKHVASWNELNLCITMALALEVQERIARPFAIPPYWDADSENFTDMVVSSGGQDFKVHRNVLSAQSPILKAMLSTNMAEDRNRRLELIDMDQATTVSFLNYLYTGYCRDVCNTDLVPVPNGDWYHVYDFQVAPPSNYCLLFTTSDCNAMPVSQISCDGRRLRVFRPASQERLAQHGPCCTGFGCIGCSARTPNIDCTMISRGHGHGVWEGVDEHGDKVTIRYEEGALRWSAPYGESCLHCKDGELQFAKSWGELLRAADKYQIADLIELCATHMVQRISIWSATTMLQYACSANQQLLKRDIMRFITLTDDVFRNIRDLREFDSLAGDLKDEITGVLMDRRIPPTPPPDKKRRGGSPSQREFADGQDWRRFSLAQLRRACDERDLATGDRAEMVSLLEAQESAPREISSPEESSA